MINYKYWEAKFKPCPFCGFDKIRLLPQGYGLSVDCTLCNAMKKVIWPDTVGMNACLQAVAAWNQRAKR